jgi:hypothetical protein
MERWNGVPEKRNFIGISLKKPWCPDTIFEAFLFSPNSFFSLTCHHSILMFFFSSLQTTNVKSLDLCSEMSCPLQSLQQSDSRWINEYICIKGLALPLSLPWFGNFFFYSRGWENRTKIWLDSYIQYLTTESGMCVKMLQGVCFQSGTTECPRTSNQSEFLNNYSWYEHFSQRFVAHCQISEPKAYFWRIFGSARSTGNVIS